MLKNKDSPLNSCVTHTVADECHTVYIFCRYVRSLAKILQENIKRTKLMHIPQKLEGLLDFSFLTS